MTIKQKINELFSLLFVESHGTNIIFAIHYQHKLQTYLIYYFVQVFWIWWRVICPGKIGRLIRGVIITENSFAQSVIDAEPDSATCLMIQCYSFIIYSISLNLFFWKLESELHTTALLKNLSHDTNQRLQNLLKAWYPWESASCFNESVHSKAII